MNAPFVTVAAFIRTVELAALLAKERVALHIEVVKKNVLIVAAQAIKWMEIYPVQDVEARDLFIHKEMAANLRKHLTKNRKELIRNVTSLRENFRKKEKEIRSDLKEASEIWYKMGETLKAKKSRERGGTK